MTNYGIAIAYMQGILKRTLQPFPELLALLEGCARSPGVRLFIGEESGFEPLKGYSLVSAPYGADGHVLGAIGVIGPTRMAYDRVIPVVQAAADVLGAALQPPAEGREPA